LRCRQDDSLIVVVLLHMAQETGAIPRKTKRKLGFVKPMAIPRKATGEKAAIQGARDKPQGASSLAVLTAAAGRTHKCISSVHMYGTMGERLLLFTAQN